MVLNPEITVGNILTILSIFVLVIALLIPWSKDQRIRKKDHADKVRNAAGKTLAKLERWEELSLRYYQDVQPLFVEASEKLAKGFHVVAVRDFLWRVKRILVRRTPFPSSTVDTK